MAHFTNRIPTRDVLTAQDNRISRYAFAIMYSRSTYVLRYGIYKRVSNSLRFPSLRVSLTLRPPERYRSFLAFLSSRSAYVSPISPEEPRWNTGERPCISSRKLAASARRITAKDSDLRIRTNCWNQIIDNLRNYRHSRNSYVKKFDNCIWIIFHFIFQ